MADGSTEYLEELFVKVEALTDVRSFEQSSAFVEKLDKDIKALNASINKQEVALNRAGEAADKKAERGFKRLSATTTALGARLAGLPGPIGDLTRLFLDFAPGGPVVGVALAGLSALAIVFKKLRDESDALDKSIADTQARIFDFAQKQRTAGDPLGVAQQAKAVAEANALLAARDFATTAERFGGDSERTRAARQRLDEAVQLVKEATEGLAKAEDEFDKAQGKLAADLAADAKGKTDATVAVAKERARLAAEIRAVQQQALVGIAELSGDDLQVQLAQLDAVIAQQQAALERLGAAAPDALVEYIAKLQELRVLYAGLIQNAERLQVVAESLPDAIADNTPAILRGANRTGIDGPNIVGTSDVNLQKESAELAAKTAESIEAQAAQIDRAVRGAIQLGEAFGLVDQQTAAVLQNLSQVASSLPVLLNGIKALSSGGGIGAILSGGLGVIGGIAGIAGSLLGDSPEEEARKQAVKENTAAILELRDKIGNLGANLSGSGFAGALGILDRLGVQRFDSSNRVVARAEFNLTAEQERILKDAAAALGLTFSNTVKGLQQLDDALRASELTQFADSFAGQLERFRTELDLFDIDEPIKQLETFRSIFGRSLGSSGGFGQIIRNNNALGRLLQGADFSSAAGRAQLEAQVRALFEEFQGLQQSEIPGFLGDLTGQEFLDALRQIEGLLDEAERASTGRTEGIVIQRTITEVTGNKIAAYLSTANVWAEQTARNTAALVALLSASQGAPAAGVTVAPVDMAAIDRALADRASLRARAAGNVVVA